MIEKEDEEKEKEKEREKGKTADDIIKDLKAQLKYVLEVLITDGILKFNQHTKNDPLITSDMLANLLAT